MSFKSKLNSIFSWLDANLIFALSLFLIAFIPLFPKIPLFSPIEQYIVRVRFEDILILFTGIIWLIQVFRGKIKWLSAMFWAVVAYALVGALSTLTAFFIVNTVPLQPLHVGKTLLHYFRYLEYFSLFFFMFASIKSRVQVKIALVVIALTVISISVYGYGQRFFYFPVYSTMNREFSKGVRLTLSENARVQSTFGGHYDMGGYMAMMLPLLLAFAYGKMNCKKTVIFYLAYALGAWLLVLSASRTAFVAFLIGSALVGLLHLIFKKSLQEKLSLVIGQGILTLATIILIVYYFGGDMSQRLDFFLRNFPVYVTSMEAAQKQSEAVGFSSALALLPTPTELYSWLPKGERPTNTISTDDVIAAARFNELKATPTPAPTSTKPGPTPLPSPKIVYIPPSTTATAPTDKIEEPVVYIEEATVSATGEVIITRRPKIEVYSDCSLEKELSLCIRQEVLWPQAMEGFLNYPLLGSGYATLTKASVDQFTEADSTDNNYLRTLGETGALGFITFYGIIAIILIAAVQHLRTEDELVKIFSIGMIGGTVALLVNAVYIDVFAASKIAQSYWLVAGLYFGLLLINQKSAVSFPYFSRQIKSQTTTKSTRSVKKK